MKIAPPFNMLVGTCVWLLLLHLWSAQSVSIQKFYPFGVENGDSQLSRFVHEVSSPELQLRVPIKFYSEIFNSLFVNANGLISFFTPLPIFVNTQFPLDYPVISALYANVDLRSIGAVYYRETDNPTLLNRVNEEIRQSFPNSRARFQATSIFIATWYKVGYYDRRADKVNTYQIVIASNNEETYAEFLYADDGIQWLQGEGLAGTGVPDANAQAGFVAANGRTYILQGSGTDQIRNLVRLTNTNEAGVWVFKIGSFDNDTNIGVPVTSQILSEQVNLGDQIIPTCAVGYSRCHSQATCVDSVKGFCCTCRQGFYGNGFTCLKDGVPVRATGKVNIDVNGIRLTQIDLQAYVVVQDGRVYTAISKVSPAVGPQLQLLYPITTVLNWLFAKPTGNGLNGFQITGGMLNHSAEILYKESKDRVSVTQKYFGMDVHDQLRLEARIQGSVPQDKRDYKLFINDYQEQFNFASKGMFRSSSPLVYTKTFAATDQEEKQNVSLDQTIVFNESCVLNFNSVSEPTQRSQYNYYRVKTARNFVSYENRENILRFAATSKVSLLKENEDPCIEGRVKCVANSSCVVESDSFRCICNPGFQTTYTSAYSDSRSNEFGCLDVNECAEGKASCDSNAICLNEVGSYKCLCKPGYTGNGFFCSAIEIESPCVRNPSLCNPPNSHCVDPIDHRTCDCITGYQKQYQNESQIGFSCVDINECELDAAYANICGANSYCVNYPGSYTCACREGYTRDGNTCQPRDASCNVLRNCSPNGECVYDVTSAKYTCRCIRGYYGDGYICQQYGGRKIVPKVCTSGACVCPPRFIAHDNYCIENEYGAVIPTESSISCNIMSSMCHPQAQCVHNSTSQQYQCVCNAGFEGNGIECAETELSCQRSDICDPKASCQPDANGKYHCVCNTHYQGDGIHCIYSGMCNSDGDCSQDEECAYNEVSYTYECKCRVGYSRGPNATCQPFIRCPKCHDYAQCVTDQSTRIGRCECLPGYRGNGVSSCDIAPQSCNVNNYCSPYAVCLYNSTADSYQCQCKPGYIGDGTNCRLVPNCLQNPRLCDTNARCIARRYDQQPYCECNPGFTGNGYNCTGVEKPEGGFLLVNHGMSTLRLPLQANASNPGVPIQLQPNQIATGLAIDCTEGKFYWSDYIGQKIKSANYRGKNIVTLVNEGISAPEGLTVDWLGRTLYWTDSKKKVIESVNLDGTQRKTIISSNLTNPRGIAVHPYKRKLFWTDWNRAQPKIEWSNLDGSERSTFLSGTEVQVPNSVAVDWNTDELCWADAGTKRISCAGIENRRVRPITSSSASPFGLTISSDKYYWTDWIPSKAEYYDRFTFKTGSIPLPSVGSGTLYGIVAVPNNCP